MSSDGSPESDESPSTDRSMSLERSANSAVTIAYATFPDAATAERISKTLVTEGVIRCANVFAPHVSIYRWDGEVKAGAEVAAIFKLPRTQRETLAQRFLELHPFEVPALVYVDVTGGLDSFLGWVSEA